LTKKNKEIIKNRFKSLGWRLGAYALVILIGEILQSLHLFDLSPYLEAVIAFGLGEITKYINVNYPELKKLESKR